MKSFYNNSQFLVVINVTSILKALTIFAFTALLMVMIGCSGQVNSPDVEPAAVLPEQETGAEQTELKEEVDITMPASENNQKPEKPDQDLSQPAAENSEPVIPPGEDTMPLLIDLTEISLEAYREKHSLEDQMSHPITAAATRIGIAKINPSLFDQHSLRVGSTVSFKLFDSVELKFRIKNFSTGSPAAFSGVAENGQTGFLFAGITGDSIMVTVELSDRNQIYLLRYSPKSGSHYLFLAPLQGLDVLEDAPPLIPPDFD